MIAVVGLHQEEYTVVQESATKDEQLLHWHCAECNKNAVGVLEMIKVMQERQDRMEKEISELKKEINGVKKCVDDASRKYMEIMRKEMAAVVKSMNEDMNKMKTFLAQEAMKLETAIEIKLVDSVGERESVQLCYRIEKRCCRNRARRQDFEWKEARIWVPAPKWVRGVTSRKIVKNVHAIWCNILYLLHTNHHFSKL